MEDVLVSQFDSLALRFVWTIVIVLFLLTFYLFIAAILVRRARKNDAAYYESKKEALYPYILSGLLGEEVNATELNTLLKTPDDIRPYVDIIIEFMNNVKGVEFRRMQKMLVLPEVRKFHFHLIRSKSSVQITEGCMYYARIKDLKEREYHELERHLESANQLISHAAATGLMSSSKVSVRLKAVYRMMKSRRISRMALLEIMYLYHHETQDQMEEESSGILKIIKDKSLPAKNIAQLIRGIADVGYNNLSLELFELLSNADPEKTDAELLEALIHTLGIFGFSPISEIIREKFIHHTNYRIRRACVAALDQFGDDGTVDILEVFANDDDNDIRTKSLYALAKLGEPAAPVMKRLSKKDETYAAAIETINLELGNA